MMVYRYRQISQAGEVLRRADCEIPYTRNAFILLNQELGVNQSVWNPLLARFGLAGEGEVSSQSCYDGNVWVCDYEGVVVTPDPGSGSCDPWLSLSWCKGTCLTSVGDEFSAQCGDPGGGEGPIGGGGGGGDPGDGSEPCREVGIDPMAAQSLNCADYDSGTRSGPGECPTCKDHEPQHRERYDAALKLIDQQKCPELYAKAAELASTFEVWLEERFHPITGRRILGEYLDYERFLGDPSKPSTSAFWEPHLLHGAEFPITLAHEAAHGLGYGDADDEAEKYAITCMK
jgi:hypothetical protein